MRRLSKLRKYLLGYDTYFRHKRTAELCGNVNEKTVLDVGGERKLVYFINGTKLTTVNLDCGDIKCDGRNLPFQDKSFDIVVSLDVLEHIQRNDRRRFISELIRVAKQKVVICAALGTPAHEVYARRMARIYREKSGRPNIHLEEHIALGMPTLEELENYLINEKYIIFYENILGMGEAARVFRSFQAGYRLVDNFLLIFKLIFTMIHTLFMESFIYGKSVSYAPADRTNRFYVVINKG